MEHIKGAGGFFEHHDAYAERSGNTLTFLAYVRSGDGTSLSVTAPYLTTEEAASWIKQRLSKFHDAPNGRESQDMAIRRKTLAAHGQPFLEHVKASLSDMEKMEYDMMFSPKSHTGLADASLLPTTPLPITVDRKGHVSGLKPRPLEPAEPQDAEFPDFQPTLDALGKKT